MKKIIKTELINICIQGLGYVGAATIAAVARAKDNKSNPIYNVIGLDINNKSGRQRIDSINRGHFPFQAQDQELLKSIKNAHKEKRLIASYDVRYIKKADIIFVAIPHKSYDNLSFKDKRIINVWT